MKKYSKLPTEENVLALFKEDWLGRRQELFYFVRLLDAIEEGCSIALNGEWGSGKTFFVKQAKMILDADNPGSNISEEIRCTVKALLPDDMILHDCHSTVYYDAWANDNHDDPILSLIYATIASCQSDFSPENGGKLLDAAAALADALSGKSYFDALKKLKQGDQLQSIRDSETIREMVKEFLDSLILERGNRLVVFVDELDRCRPDYAVKLLERIKHYFDDERVTFVFSVCLSELQWTVRNHYGSQFNSARYLDKFFDLRVSLAEVDRKTFLKNCLDFSGERSVYYLVCEEVVQRQKFSLREIEHYVRLVRIASGLGTPNLINRGMEFALQYVVPIMIGLQMSDADAYTRFINGQNVQPMLDVLSGQPRYLVRQQLLDFDEAFEDDHEYAKENATSFVLFSDRLNRSYEALFVDDSFEEASTIKVGKIVFTRGIKREIQKVAGLLSPIAQYHSD